MTTLLAPKTLLLLAMCGGFLLTSGCATPVTVRSTPPGASVYMRGSGRPAYRWSAKGNTPASFRVPYNAIQVFVRWPDGTRSEIRRASLLLEDQVTLDFSQNATPKAPQTAAPETGTK